MPRPVRTSDRALIERAELSSAAPFAHPRPVTAAVAMALVALGGAHVERAHAQQPTGGQVVAGSATIRQSGAQTTIDQTSNRVALDWQAFSIGRNEAVIFNQPSSASVALNRVIGPNPSEILGTLRANGSVFLINPSGILFGRGASVDVAGLVASTANISNADFMAGRNVFTGAGIGRVVNEGDIRVKEGGYVALLANQVSNSGSITAPKGSVALAAGQDMVLDFHGDGLLSVKVNAAAAGAKIDHSGIIVADGGRVIMSAAARNALLDTVLNVDGIVQARGAVERNGSIYLEGGDSGVTRVAGTLDVSSNVPGGKGGEVRVLGEYVGLFDHARIDASGTAGGGTVLVGGDFQGRNAEVSNATRSFVDRHAVVKADAIESGDGGKVIVWANDTTQFYGNISARGGARSGNGGFVETSGKQILDSTGLVDASAANGRAGRWLLDPFNLTISNNLSSPTVTAFDATENDANLQASTIQAALNAGTSVTVTTGSSGTQAGDITVFGSNDAGGAVDINKTAGAAATIKLEAAGSIVIKEGAQLRSSADKLNVVLNADRDANGTGGIEMQSGSKILSNGGTITLGGGTDPTATPAAGTGTSNGVFLNEAELQSAGGAITIRGRGVDPQGGRGVVLTKSTLQSASGDITIVGEGVRATTDAGVQLSNTSLGSTTGNIAITGTSNAVTGTTNNGVNVLDASVIQTSDGNISLTGTGSAVGSSSVGVLIVNANNTIQSTGSGNITIAGTARSTDVASTGVFATDSTVISTVGGNIDITGTAGGGSNQGVSLAGTGSAVRSASGSIAITGTGKGGGLGVRTEDLTIGSATMSGNILVRSLAGSGIDLRGSVLRTNPALPTVVTLNLVGGGSVNQLGGSVGGSAAIISGGLRLLSDDAARFNLQSASNDVGVLAADVKLNSFALAYVDAGSFKVGALTSDHDADSGTAVTTSTGITADERVTLTALGTGDITVSNNIVKTGTANQSVNIVANRNIVFDSSADVTVAGGASGRNDVVLNADADATGGGAIRLNSGTVINSNGGSITLGGGASPGTVAAIGGAGGLDNGVSLANAQLNSGGGGIKVRGTGATTGSAKGVEISSASVIAAAGGSIEIVGTGGTVGSGSDHYGVEIGSGTATVSTTGSGTILISGTGGTGGNDNHGVLIGSTTVSTVDGSLQITGLAGNNNSQGIRLSTNNTNVRSTGSSAAITLTGTGSGGGAGIAANVDSVGNNFTPGGTVTIGGATTTAPISLVALSGTNIALGKTGAAANVTNTTATGTIALTANGGGTISHNNGTIGAAAPITLTADDMVIGAPVAASGQTVTLRPFTANRAIDLGSNNTLGLTSTELNQVTAGTLVIGRNDAGNAAGDITVSAAIAPANTSTLELRTGGSIAQTGAGTINETTLVTASATGTTLTLSNTIGAFNATNTTSGGIALTDTSSSLTLTGVAQNATGAVAVSNTGIVALGGALTAAGDVTLTAGTDITIGANRSITKSAGGDATLRLNATGNITVSQGATLQSTSNKLHVVLNADSDAIGGGRISLSGASGAVIAFTSNGGNIALGGRDTTLTGAVTGAGRFASGASNAVGVNLNFATLDAGAGSVAIAGHGGSVPSGQNAGVLLNNGSSVSANGGITIDGTGGNGGGAAQGNRGVWMSIGSSVTAGSGDIAITGVGGSGPDSFNNGVEVSSSTISSTGAANITITGTGTAGTADNYGIFVLGAPITSTGTGAVTLTGTGGSGTNSNRGVYAQAGAVETTISSATGNISISGTGGGTGISNEGVRLASATSVRSSGTAAISITGTGSGTSPLGIITAGTAAIQNTAGEGPITLTADTMDLSGGAISASGQTVTLRPLTTGRLIGLGASDSGTTLGLTGAELNRVAAGSLVVGRNDGSAAGDIVISSAIAPTGTDTLVLRTGGSITQSGGTVSETNLGLVAGTGVSLTNAGNAVLNISGLITGAGDFVYQDTNSAFTVTNLPSVNADGAGIHTANGSVTLLGAAVTVSNPISTGNSTTTSGNISLTANTLTLAVNANLTTGDVTVADAAGNETAVSGNIALSAGTNVSGTGRLRTGNATLTGVDLAGTDSATAGNISVTALTIGLSNANALVIGTASRTDATADTTNGGSITLGSNVEINNGAASTPLALTISAATGGATNNQGRLNITTSGDAGSAFITSASALRVGTLDTKDTTPQTLSIATTGDADLTLVGSSAPYALDGDLVTVGGAATGVLTVSQAVNAGSFAGAGSSVLVSNPIVTASTISGVASGNISLAANTTTVTVNANLTTGNATPGDTAGNQTAVSGSIAVSAGTNVSGTGKLQTGNAAVLGTDAAGADSATAGSINVTAGTAGASGTIGLSNANALVIGTASRSSATADTINAGNITLGSIGEINNGTASTPLALTINAATGGATNNQGVLNIATTAGAGSMFITSGSALRTGTVSATGGGAQIDIGTTGASPLVLTGAITTNRGGVSLSSGGAITSTSAGTITTSGTGGSGAVRITAATSIDLLGSVITKSIRSFAPAARGGDVAFSGPGGVAVSAIDTTGSGSESVAGGAAAGDIAFGSPASITLRENITARGGDGNSGVGTPGNGANLTFGASVILGGDVTIDTRAGGNGASAGTGGTVTFSGAIDSPTTARALTVTTPAAITFGGAVGSGSPLASLTTNGGGAVAVDGGAVITSNAQSYDNTVTVSGAAASSTLFSGSALSFNGVPALATGDHAVTLTTGVLTIGGDVTGSGTLVIQPAADDVSIGIAGASGTFALPTATLDKLQNGFSSITIGRSTGTATTTVDAYTFNDPVTIRQPGTGGKIVVNGQITGADNASITLTGSGSTTTLNAGIVTAGNAITINDAVVLGAGNVTLDATSSGGTPAGADITISGSTNASTAGAESLTLAAGTGGNIGLGAMGGSARLGNVTINSANNVTATSGITATRIQQLAGSGTSTFGALDTDGASGISITGNNVTLNGTVTTTNGGPVAITNGGVLGIAAAADMTLDGSFTQSGAGTVSTAGDITTTSDNISFGSAVTLTGNVALSTGAGAGIAFSNSVNGTTAGGQSLTLAAGTGTVTLGATGAGVALGNLSATGNSLALNDTLTAAGDITLAATGAGSNVTIGNTITRAASATDTTLTLRAGNSILFTNGADVVTDGGGKQNVVLNADRDASGAGAISLASGTVITSNGGAITLGGGADPLDNPAVGTSSGVHGVFLQNAQLRSGAGAISVRGGGRAGPSTALGVFILGGSVIESTGGAIAIAGMGGAGGQNVRGVFVTGAGTRIASASGDIGIAGTGAGTGPGSFGMQLSDGAVVSSTGTANIAISGTGVSGAPGVVLDAGTSVGSGTMAGDILLRSLSGTGMTLGADILNDGTATRNVTLSAEGGGAVAQDAGSIVSGGLRLLNDTGGGFILNSGANNVATLAGNVTGTAFYRDANALSVGAVTSVAVQGDASATTNGFTVTPGTGFGDLTLLAGGALSQAAGKTIAASSLTTSSVGGTVLNEANTVASFNATNTTSGDVQLTNTAAPLTIAGVSQSAGNLTIANTGSILTGGNVSVTGNTSITAIGANADITISRDITRNNTTAGTLDLRADRHVIFDGFGNVTATGTGGALAVTLNADRDATNGGAISVGAFTVITSNGGKITLGGGGDPANVPATGAGSLPNGVDLVSDSQLLSGAGAISIRGRSIDGAGDSHAGVSMFGATIQSVGGPIGITGEARGTNGSRSRGVAMSGSLVSTTTGDITLTGTNASSGTGSQNIGVSAGFDAATVVETLGSGSITLNGIGSSSTGGNDVGVLLVGSDTFVRSDAAGSTGRITITGNSAGTGGADHGVTIGFGASVASTAGNIVISGSNTAATGAGSHGVFISGASVVSNGAASIGITGRGNPGSTGILTSGGGNNIGGAAMTGDIVLLSLSGTGMSLDASILNDATRNVALTAAGGGTVTQTGGSIVSGGLRLLNDGAGTFNLTSAANNVVTLAGDVLGAVAYTDADALTIGSVTAPARPGEALSTADGFAVRGTGDFTATAGGAGNRLTVDIGSINAVTATLQADEMTFSGTVTGTGAVTLRPNTAGTAVTLGGGTAGLDLSNAALQKVSTPLLTIGADSGAAAGSITVGGPIAGGSQWDTLSLRTGGAVIDGNAAAGADITVTSLAVRSATGIGTAADPLETQVTNVAFSNTGAGGVAISNSGALTIAGVDGLTASNGGTGTTTLTASSPLAVAMNLIQAGSIVLTAGETAGSGDDLTLNAGTTVRSTAGDVTLRAGDRVTPGSNVLIEATRSGGAVTLVSGFNDADGVGTINGAGRVGADIVVLDSLSGVGTSDARFNTAAATLAARSRTSGGVFVTDIDGVTLDTSGGVHNGTNGGGEYNVTAAGALAINGAVTAAANGNITLTSTGAITEGGGGAGTLSTTGLLTTQSNQGQLLTNANTVGSFNATNNGAGARGNVALTNTAAPLRITGITQAGTGSVTVDNTGALAINGAITAVGGGITLTSSDAITEGGGGAGIVSTTGLLTTRSNKGQTLANANSVGSFNAANTGVGASGNITLNNTRALKVTGVTQSGGDFVAVNAGSITTAGGANTANTIDVAGNTSLTATGANADITISNSIVRNNAAAGTLDLRADRNVFVNNGADVTATGGALAVTLNADRDAANGGAISLGSGTVVISNGGAITLGGGADPLTTPARGHGEVFNGIALNGAQLQSGAGAIGLRGAGFASAASGLHVGVGLVGNSVLQSTTGSITVVGAGGAGSGGNYGTYITGASTAIRSVGGDIGIVGTGGAASGDSNYGTFIDGGALIASSGTGRIDISGTGGSGAASNNGVRIATNTTTVSSVTGGITIAGTAGPGSGAASSGTVIAGAVSSSGAADITIVGAGGTGSGNGRGVAIQDGGAVTSTSSAADAGRISITGTGAAGTDLNIGVRIGGDAAGTRVSSVAGDIAISGTAGGTGVDTYGVQVFAGSVVESTGAASIAITGVGKNGASGISTSDAGTRIGSSTMTGDVLLHSKSGTGISLAAPVTTAAAGGTRNVTLRAEGGGSVAQTGGAITANGLRLLSDSAATFTLDSATNGIGTLAGAVMGDVTFRNAGALDIGSLQTAPAAGAAATTSNGLQASSLALNADGAITQTAPITAGASSFTTGASPITLTNAANDFAGAVTLSNSGANDISIRDVNAIELGTSSAGRDLTVLAGGAITQSGTLTIAGASSFTTGANPITLANAGNDFSGAVTLSNSGANDISIRDVNAIELGASSAGRDLTVLAGGAITQSGALTVAGASSFTTGANAITLNNPGNDFNGPVSLNNSGAHNAAVTDVNALVLGTSNVAGGTLTVNAAGLSQSAGTGITADTLTGSVTTSALLDQSNAVTNLGSFTTNGNFTLNDATGGLTLTGAVNAGAGAVSISTAGGALVLQSNDVSGVGGVALQGAGVTSTGGTLATRAANNSGIASGAVQVNATGTGVIDLAGLIDTSGANSNGAAAGAGGDVTLTTHNGAMTLARVNANGGDGSAGNASGGNAGTVAINVGSGNTLTLNDNVTSRGGDASGAGNAGSGHSLTFAAPTRLGADVTIETRRGAGAGAATAGNVTFGGTVNADAAVNNRKLAVFAINGVVTFEDGIGTLQPLADLDVTGHSLVFKASAPQTVAVTAQGGNTITLNGSVSLGQNLSVITAGAVDNNVTFAGTIDADLAANKRTLFVDAGQGTVTFSGDIGKQQALADLDVISGPHSIVFDAPAAQTVNVNADSGRTITFTGTVRLNQNLALNTAGGAGNSVQFNNAVEAGAANNRTLAVNAGGGNITFNAVGSEAPLALLDVNASTIAFNATAAGQQVVISAEQVLTDPANGLIRALMPFDGFAGLAALTLKGPASGGMFGTQSTMLRVFVPGLLAVVPDDSAALPTVWLGGDIAGRPFYPYASGSGRREVMFNGAPLVPAPFDPSRQIIQQSSAELLQAANDSVGALNAEAVSDVRAPQACDASSADAPLACEGPTRKN